MTDDDTRTDDPSVAMPLAMPVQQMSFDQALCALHAAMPRIRKDETAIVKTNEGSYRYSYADLARIADEVRPRLAEHGFVFLTRPTLNPASGRFVLAYALIHAHSGERETGEYPLQEGKPQQMGSQITYARRYALVSVLGLTPDDDDDDAQDYERSTSQPASSQQQTQQRSPGQDAVARQAQRLGAAPAAVMAEFERTYATGWTGATEGQYFDFALELERRANAQGGGETT